MNSPRRPWSTAAAFVLAGAASVLVPSAVSGQPVVTDPDKALQATLTASVRDFWQAIKTKDAATVRRMMGPDGFWVDPLNVTTTEDIAGSLPRLTVDFAMGPRVFLRKLGSDTAVLLYDIRVGLGQNGQAQKPDWDWIMTDVFVNRGGTWVGVIRTETRGPTPPSRGARPVGRTATPPGAEDKALKDTLWRGVTQFWQALESRDSATVDRMMGDDGIWVDPLNIVTGREIAFKVVPRLNLDFSLGPRVYLRKLGKDAAALIYDIRVGFGQNGQPAKADWDWLMTDVFVNRGGQWVGVIRTETRSPR
jgi:ketosteroid isomerase-like protein